MAKSFQTRAPRMVKNQSDGTRRIFYGKALWATALSLALLVGCAVGPDFKAPEAPETNSFTATALPEQTEVAPVAGGDAQHFKKGGKIPRQWWLLFHSKALDQLIRQALDDNPTVAVAQASLRQAQEILADQRRAYELVKRQYQLGGISQADVLAQKAQLARTQATLPPLEKALAQTRHLLAVLVGKYPGEAGQLPAFDLHKLELPVDLPVSLPSDLVRQRPDIRSSEALLHAASARVGVATANLYPRITLTGNYGTESNSISDLFKADSTLWNLGAGLLQPLFHGGELTAARRAAIAAFQQALALYRQTVLQAFLNVADVLRPWNRTPAPFRPNLKLPWLRAKLFNSPKNNFDSVRSAIFPCWMPSASMSMNPAS